jgi:hypothetical protein
MSCTRAPKLTFDKVFATLDQFGEGALVIGADAFFDGQSERLAALRSAMQAIDMKSNLA